MSRFVIYWLISELRDKIYVGFSDNIQSRLLQHRRQQVKTTKSFGKFRSYILERVDDLDKARIREKYWKSAAGRRKLKEYFKKIESPSSPPRIDKRDASRGG
jgi:putative endonuclease